MADKAPEHEGEAPYYEVRGNKIFIEGVDVTEIVNPGAEPEESEAAEDPKPPAEPALEGEGEEPEEVEEKEQPEQKKAEPEEPAEQPEVPEPKTEPDKWKFKLKFRGKEEEVEWDHGSVQHRLAKLRAFEENEKEFWDKRREVEPYWNIVKSDWFKERLKEGYESGELEKPVAPPEPPASVQYDILKRQADPDYDDVLSALQTYALSLPPKAMSLIDSDPTVFLAEYDRIAADLRKPKEPEKKEPPAPPKADPEEVKKKLALKESAKTRANVNKPGTSAEPVPEIKRWESRKRELERAMRDPANYNRNLDLTAQLLLHMENKPTT